MSDAVNALPARVTGLEESLILQVAARAMAREDSIALYAGESDQPTPAFIVEAANLALQQGHTRYTLSRGIGPLREAIARYLNRTYPCNVSADQITVTVGGMQAISQSLLAIVEPGDQVLVPVPVWPNVMQATSVAGAQAVPVPMQFDSSKGWTLDLDRLIDSIGPKTRAVFINSPSNPTGWVMSDEDVRAVLSVCRERGVWVIADEVYGRLFYDHESPGYAPTFLAACDPEDKVIVTNTMSKNWSMTGWRVGWAVHPPSLGLVFDNLMQYGSTGTATFAQHAAVTALDHGDSHIGAMVKDCTRARETICSALASVPGIRMVPPDGAFYLFFGLEGLKDSRQLAFNLLDSTGVGLAPGAAFHASGEGWMRLCFGVAQPTLETAAGRLAAALSALK